MKNIIKYQLLNRLQTFRIAAPIVAGLNILVAIVYGFQHISGQDSASGTIGFISFLAIASALFVPLVHFFTASSGHVTEILKKETSYLILTIPRSGMVIQGGRMIAGLIEFLAYLLVSFFSLLLNFTIFSGTVLGEQIGINDLAAFNDFMDQTIFTNLPEMLKFLVIIIFNFFILGSLISFAAITSASFIRKRKPATVLAVIGALFVFNIIATTGSMLGEEIAPNAKIILQGANIELNVITALFMFLMATTLFYFSSYLLEKKLEV